MKKNTTILIAAFSLLALFAWSKRQKDDLSQLQWLIGTWENKTVRGSMYEQWTRTNENEFSGKSFMKKGSDTVVFENIRLVKENHLLFYIPAVKAQNGGLPIRFGLKVRSETQLVFENPAHDFPQIISYTKVNADSLVAEIAGTKNGQPRKQVFPMKRVK